MAKITANGNTPLGEYFVEIIGTERVDAISCADAFFQYVIESGIKQELGQMANGYRPSAGTMLQAFAFVSELFGEQNVTVDGDIGKIQFVKDVVF